MSIRSALNRGYQRGLDRRKPKRASKKLTEAEKLKLKRILRNL